MLSVKGKPQMIMYHVRPFTTLKTKQNYTMHLGIQILVVKPFFKRNGMTKCREGDRKEGIKEEHLSSF